MPLFVRDTQGVRLAQQPRGLSPLRLPGAPIQALPPLPEEPKPEGRERGSMLPAFGVPPSLIAGPPMDAFAGVPVTPSAPGLPPISEPMQLQEPMQLGMFAGSVTFLSAQVDPNASQAAAEAIVRGQITGENIVRGIFPPPRAQGL